VLTDKQSYYAHLAMVAVSLVIGTITFGDYFNPTTSKLIFQLLTVSYGVLGFVVNGVMPPASGKTVAPDPAPAPTPPVAKP
jgi:hypothetical protein